MREIVYIYCFLPFILFGQTNTINATVAIEVCPSESVFTFCKDGFELILNPRHVIINPDLKAQKFESFYSDTVLNLSSLYFSSSQLDSLFSFIDEKNINSLHCYKINRIKKLINRRFKKMDTDLTFDGKFYFIVLNVKIEYRLNENKEITIFNSGRIKNNNIFKELNVVSGDVLRIDLVM